MYAVRLQPLTSTQYAVALTGFSAWELALVYARRQREEDAEKGNHEAVDVCGNLIVGLVWEVKFRCLQNKFRVCLGYGRHRGAECSAAWRGCPEAAAPPDLSRGAD